jgi:MATE family multidrug resistance protein
MLSAFMVQVVNISFAGHLGSQAALAGVGLANMFQNILCFSLIYGFNSSLNTLVPQAFGMKKFKMCGVFHNRARFVMTLLFVPLLITLLCTEKLFVAVGFDPEASHYA